MRTRTFQKGDRVWEATLYPDCVQLRHGKAGGKLRERSVACTDMLHARREFDRLIAATLEDGYAETMPKQRTPILGATGKALEKALVADPDDLPAHMAYADWLAEQADPALQARGELVRVQLALEDESLPRAERKKLSEREAELLGGESDAGWLDESLADFLLSGRCDDMGESAQNESGWGDCIWRRGWIDHLTIGLLSEELAEAIDQARCLRLLRGLAVLDTHWQGEPFSLLDGTKNLGNVRTFRVSDYGAFDVWRLVRSLPRLEELYLHASRGDCDDVFGLRNLRHLRVLEVHGSDDYPLDELAANPVLANLTHLSLWPHAIEAGEAPFIRVAGVRALVRSRHLRSLRHLEVKLSDAGDAGCAELVESGILARLETLVFGPGTVTDIGAAMLAACPAVKSLKKLDLSGNRLSRRGVRLLREAGVNLRAADQQTGNEDGEFDDDYLYEGDSE
jgi:uncharacterized protein (TIGR02996 family)